MMALQKEGFGARKVRVGSHYLVFQDKAISIKTSLLQRESFFSVSKQNDL